jgi:hypothetical protein
MAEGMERASTWFSFLTPSGSWPAWLSDAKRMPYTAGRTSFCLGSG